MTRDDCIALDTSDPLAAHRDKFALPEGVIYLDGNSLGALPRATRERVGQVIDHEWGEGLIRSWNAAHWIDLPRRVGAKIARLIGAQPHEVICADSTSINLFKVLTTALRLQASRPQGSLRERKVILSEEAGQPATSGTATTGTGGQTGSPRTRSTGAISPSLTRRYAGWSKRRARSVTVAGSTSVSTTACSAQRRSSSKVAPTLTTALDQRSLRTSLRWAARLSFRLEGRPPGFQAVST